MMNALTQALQFISDHTNMEQLVTGTLIAAATLLLSIPAGIILLVVMGLLFWLGLCGRVVTCPHCGADAPDYGLKRTVPKNDNGDAHGPSDS